MPDIWSQAKAERERAHAKHGDKSMEAAPWTAERRLRILLEEVGEVAREFNDAELDGRPIDPVRLFGELLQVTAMAGAWADVVRAATLDGVTASSETGEHPAGGDAAPATLHELRVALDLAVRTVARMLDGDADVARALGMTLPENDEDWPDFLADGLVDTAKARMAALARVEALCAEMERQCWMGHEYEQAHPEEPAALLLPVRDIRAALGGASGE